MKTRIHHHRLAVGLAGILTLAALSPASAQLTLVLSNAWSLPADTYGFIPSSGNNPRGIAINRTTGNVLVPSVGSPNTVQVLSGADGSLLGSLSPVTGVQGGNLIAIIHVAVADDGVIYACNLDSAQNFRVYRWDAEDISGTITPTLAFAGVTATNVANNRAGDAFYVRGAGTNTQLIVSGTGSSFFSVFTTVDGTNFTATSFRLPAPLDPGGARRGVAFDGTNNTFYAIAPNSTALYKVGFNLATSNATVLATNTLSTPVSMIAVRKVGDTKVLTAIQDNGGSPGVHNLIVYDLTGEPLINPVVGGNVAFPAPPTQDVNITGATDISNDLIVGLNTHNGIVALSNVFLPPVAPEVVVNPADTAVIETWFATLLGDATGTQPQYQWYFNGNPIPNATNKTLIIPNVQAANAGEYHFVVTNSVGTANSSTGILTVVAANFSSVATPLWRITNSTRPYLQNDNASRGLAFNALSNQVLIVSRSGAPAVHLLNANTGATITNLDMTGVGGKAGETLPVNMIGVADDGAVYVCNLTLTGGGFTIYRWADTDPTTIATVAYDSSISGPPVSERIGDTFAVKGSGVNTRLFAATRSGTAVVVFTTSDGINFNANTVDVTEAAGGFAGLGLAAGDGDTFWATAPNFLLRKVFYDLNQGTNAVQLTLGGQSGYNIAADNQNQLIFSIGTADTPSNLRVLDVFGQTNAAPLIDREFFPTDNPNGNGTGAVAVDVAGGRCFALDSNNGVLAVKYAPPIRFSSAGSNLTMTWYGPAVLQRAPVVTGTYTNVPSAPSPHTTSQPGYYRLTN